MTNDQYWDCNCKAHYIHKKTHRLGCPLCNTAETHQPDSMELEIETFKNHFLPKKLINASTAAETLQEHPIQNHDDLRIIISAFDAWEGWYDQEGCFYDYDTSQNTEGSIIAGNDLYKEIIVLISDPEARQDCLEFLNDEEPKPEIIFEHGTADFKGKQTIESFFSELHRIAKNQPKKGDQDLAYAKALDDLTSRLTADQKAAIAYPPLSAAQLHALLHSLQKHLNTIILDKEPLSQLLPKVVPDYRSILQLLLLLIAQYQDSVNRQASENPQADPSLDPQAPEKPKD